jgi:hypothetical protein
MKKCEERKKLELFQDESSNAGTEKTILFLEKKDEKQKETQCNAASEDLSTNVFLRMAEKEAELLERNSSLAAADEKTMLLHPHSPGISFQKESLPSFPPSPPSPPSD